MAPPHLFRFCLPHHYFCLQPFLTISFTFLRSFTVLVLLLLYPLALVAKCHFRRKKTKTRISPGQKGPDPACSVNLQRYTRASTSILSSSRNGLQRHRLTFDSLSPRGLRTTSADRVGHEKGDLRCDAICKASKKRPFPTLSRF